MTKPFALLTINGGSSSIRFSCYEKEQVLQCVWSGVLDRIGQRESHFTVKDATGVLKEKRTLNLSDHHAAISFLLDWFEEEDVFASIKAVGHRVVHGMKHSKPELITEELLKELHQIIPYDPEHLPLEIGLIEDIRQRHPTLTQVACFDTAFHQTMPRISTLLPIPRRYDAMGIRRYGFHGLSYEFLKEELLRLGDPAITKGRVILAHLGSGASMAALRDGKSIDTSMGFTPTSGLVMSSRSGDLDPGLVSYLARTERMSATQFQKMVNHASGLLGISETSSDMHDLLQREKEDVRAAEAIALFCYQAKKWLGAFAAALGGLDTLVFSGGIGENAPVIRTRICEGLEFLGIILDEKKNIAQEGLISSAASRVTVRVVPTNEEKMIAKMVCRVLNLNNHENQNPIAGVTS
ncbi:MAG TPA: acetate/propionate family kinase [Chthoniobacterales bacterium]|nr:acetate/propionate family kinase [Chthoniobacterales bacterium]